MSIDRTRSLHTKKAEPSLKISKWTLHLQHIANQFRVSMMNRRILQFNITRLADIIIPSIFIVLLMVPKFAWRNYTYLWMRVSASSRTGAKPGRLTALDQPR